MHHILILGGTCDARSLAERLVAAGENITYSLAGVTQEPQLPKARLRVGGFGGVAGLVAYLQQNTITNVVDATHPYAAQMSVHAVQACNITGLSLLRFERPAWQQQSGDHWQVVETVEAAAASLPLGACAFLTTGRKNLEPFFARSDVSGLLRTVERPSLQVPAAWQLLQDRPPHTLEQEIHTLKQHRITHVVSKNAGGAATYAKIEAARHLQLPVIMVARPNKPPCESFSNMENLMAAIGVER